MKTASLCPVSANPSHSFVNVIFYTFHSLFRSLSAIYFSLLSNGLVKNEHSEEKNFGKKQRLLWARKGSSRPDMVHFSYVSLFSFDHFAHCYINCVLVFITLIPYRDSLDFQRYIFCIICICKLVGCVSCSLFRYCHTLYQVSLFLVKLDYYNPIQNQ